MGNVMCLLSGMLLGPLYGGIAAGVGSMLFDLTNPTYISSAPFTLVLSLEWLGCVEKSFSNVQIESVFGAGAAAGAFFYVVLYIVKNFIEYRFVFAMPLEGVLPYDRTKRCRVLYKCGFIYYCRCAVGSSTETTRPERAEPAGILITIYFLLKFDANALTLHITLLILFLR